MVDHLRRRFIAILEATAATAVAAPSRSAGRKPPDVLVFDDLERFESLLAIESTAALVASYLTGQSRGLAAYRKAYGVSEADFVERITERPRFYRSLSGLRERLRPFEAETLRAMRRIRALIPETPEVPVFVFVGTLGPGATAKEVTPEGGERGLGILIPIEALAITSATDMSEFPEGRAGRGDVASLAGLVAHEYAHVAQVQLQGLERYRRLYTDDGRDTHLAYAVREGGADLLSWLATGSLRERHRYMLANEHRLWHEFQPLADQPVSASKGWFGGLDQRRPDRPVQLGYALGWAICRHYYESAADRPRALRELLSALEPADFDAIVAPYRTRMDGPFA